MFSLYYYESLILISELILHIQDYDQSNFHLQVRENCSSDQCLLVASHFIKNKIYVDYQDQYNLSLVTVLSSLPSIL